MHFQPALLIPLACAFVYVLGAMAVKHAALLGADVWRCSFLSNLAMSVLFVPLWLWADGPVPPLADFLQPVVVGVLFLGGQALTFFALSTGDVTVVTPVMGTKVILVALGTSLLHVGAVPLQWWIGAGLSSLAILLLHSGEAHRKKAVVRTALLTFASALSFSISDVLLQKWLPAWGSIRFLPVMFLTSGLLSFGFLPLFHAPLSQLNAAAWRWLAAGALLLAANNAAFVLSISLAGSATAVNIVYSARGLFSVLLVWLVGHWFRNDEGRLGGRVLRRRFAGAGLMLAAIALVLA